jgi:hypothetical protein
MNWRLHLRSCLLVQVLLLLPCLVPMLLHLLMLLPCPNLSSCSGPSCWPVRRVVEACGLECGASDHGLALNYEERSEHLAFCDVWCQTGRGYPQRRGKLGSKS